MESYFLKPGSLSSHASSVTNDPRRPLHLLSAFRLFISASFFLLYVTDNLITPLGSYNPEAFFTYSVVYLLLGIGIWLTLNTQSIPFTFKVWISALTDIILLTLLMHASGGIQALATIVILIEQFYISLSYPLGNSYPFAGLLGTTYFATAILFMYVASRVRESEDLAARRTDANRCYRIRSKWRYSSG